MGCGKQKWTELPRSSGACLDCGPGSPCWGRKGGRNPNLSPETKYDTAINNPRLVRVQYKHVCSGSTCAGQLACASVL